MKILSDNINALKTYLNPSRNQSFTLTTLQVLEAEERNGAQVRTMMRFFLSILFLIGGLIGSGLRLSYLIINILFAFFVFGSAEVNRRITKCDSLPAIRRASYIGVIFDYIVVVGYSIVYWWMVAPNEFIYVVKTPLLILLVIPIVYSIVEFRLGLILFSIAIGLITVGCLFFAALVYKVKLGSDWPEHVLGNSFSPIVFLSVYPLVLLALGVVVSYATIRSISMAQRIGTMEAQKNVLSRYFSPSVVSDLTKNPDQISIGKRQKVTVLFSDLRGFTALSEKMTAEQVVLFLTELRNLQTKAVFEFGGTVDKFIGDAIMAVFGMPRKSEIAGEDTLKAVQCAKRMIELLNHLNKERQNKGLPLLSVGIGIHTGEAIAGNIGNIDRMEYTVIGDTVNTASRIESLTKKLHKTIIVSQAVKNELDNTESNFKLETLPKIIVKGKEQPLQVYSIALD